MSLYFDVYDEIFMKRVQLNLSESYISISLILLIQMPQS